jgi:hypothetical protein
LRRGNCGGVLGFFFGIFRVYLMLQSRGRVVGERMLKKNIKINLKRPHVFSLTIRNFNNLST